MNISGYKPRFYDHWTWGGVLTVVLPILVIVGSFVWVSQRCSDISKETGVPTKWSFISGCYVQLDGKWVPEERWRTIKEQ